MSSHGDQLTPREHAYIRAVVAYASGSLPKANDEFCNMLIDYPLGIIKQFLVVNDTLCPLQKLILSPIIYSHILGVAKNYDVIIIIYLVDAIALRIALISLSFVGQFERMRDMLASSLVHWSEGMPLYPYILGL